MDKALPQFTDQSFALFKIMNLAADFRLLRTDKFTNATRTPWTHRSWVMRVLTS